MNQKYIIIGISVVVVCILLVYQYFTIKKTKNNTKNNTSDKIDDNIKTGATGTAGTKTEDAIITTMLPSYTPDPTSNTPIYTPTPASTPVNTTPVYTPLVAAGGPIPINTPAPVTSPILPGDNRLCPEGSSIAGSGTITIHGCKCHDRNWVWVPTANKCEVCPRGSSPFGTAQPTSKAGCKCNDNNWVWNPSTGVCDNCQSGSSISGTGQTTSISGCKCPNNSWSWIFAENRCVQCPANSSINGSGQNTITPGCRCNDGKIYTTDGCV
jgi:hypothetical protein